MDDLEPDVAAVTVVVDGYNVVGAVPDGWWRDRPAAVHRLVARLACYRRQVDRRVLLVLDVVQDDLPEGDHDGVEVRYARRAGRNAADARIVELVENELDDDAVEVITSDRALRDDVALLGATVTGARSFLARLDRLDC